MKYLNISSILVFIIKSLLFLLLSLENYSFSLFENILNKTKFLNYLDIGKQNDFTLFLYIDIH